MREAEMVVEDLAGRDVKKISPGPVPRFISKKTEAQKSEGDIVKWQVWSRIRIFCLLRFMLSTAPHPSSCVRFC